MKMREQVFLTKGAKAMGTSGNELKDLDYNEIHQQDLQLNMDALGRLGTNIRFLFNVFWRPVDGLVREPHCIERKRRSGELVFSYSSNLMTNTPLQANAKTSFREANYKVFYFVLGVCFSK